MQARQKSISRFINYRDADQSVAKLEKLKCGEQKADVSRRVFFWNVNVIYRTFVEMSVTLVFRVPWARVHQQTTLTSFPDHSLDYIP